MRFWLWLAAASSSSIFNKSAVRDGGERERVMEAGCGSVEEVNNIQCLPAALPLRETAAVCFCP